jgi:hypothetical protein
MKRAGLSIVVSLLFMELLTVPSAEARIFEEIERSGYFKSLQ